jgi:hypothetical protein
MIDFLSQSVFSPSGLREKKFRRKNFLQVPPTLKRSIKKLEKGQTKKGIFRLLGLVQ